MKQLLIKPSQLVKTLFLIYLIIGCFLVQDYGVGPSEVFQHNHGKKTLNFYLPQQLQIQNIPPIPFRHALHHGSFFHTLSAGILELFETNDTRDIYLFRHYLCFFIFFIGLIFFYKISMLLFFCQYTSLLSVVTLVLHTRIFSHSFFNLPDISFLAMFIISIFYMHKFIENKNSKFAIIHGVSCAILVFGIKIFGAFIPFVTTVYFFSTLNNRWQLLKYLLLYLVTFFIISFAIDPYLWDSPFITIFERLNVLKVYSWRTSRLHNLKLILMTTSPIIFGLMLYSLIGHFKSIFTSFGFYFTKKKLHFSITLWATVPIMVPIVLDMHGYDGWRHQYFVYPSIVLLAVVAGREIYFKIKHKVVIWAVVTVNILYATGVLVYYHPYQHSTFHLLAKLNIIDVKNRLTTASFFTFKEMFEYIQSIDQRQTVTITSQYPSLTPNFLILDALTRSKFELITMYDIKRVLKIPDNQCLQVFLKQFANESEGGIYQFDHQLNELQLRGNMILFLKDKLSNCYNDNATKKQIDEFYQRGQYLQARKQFLQIRSRVDYLIDTSKHNNTSMKLIKQINLPRVSFYLYKK
ncbi:MAG: hypothetical protein ISR65_17950 [Bacteriovoracaceae bacterium]|nr:hypothetical protein [Bacteriovoracaceae bacterium]